MTELSKFVHTIQRDKTQRGVYQTAQRLRRMGLSLKAAVLLLARAHQDEH